MIKNVKALPPLRHLPVFAPQMKVEEDLEEIKRSGEFATGLPSPQS